MNIKKIFFLLIFSIVFCDCAGAEVVTDYRNKINLFFDGIGNNKVNEALESLLLGVPYSESRIQAKVKFSIGIEDVIRSKGKLSGYDIIFERKVARNIVYIYSFSYFEKSPIRFEFIFRKLESDWILSHMDISVDAAKDIRYAIVNRLVQMNSPVQP
ncbi:MAG: hypothetical protein B9S32_12175 [Verrucomicrobia bacterium Tous-C9LFEB]|nr:MAG: hypothetical protein B9S32_12175 [Verrucomicrobia bacterium Tous-C9LFEB]